MPRGIKAKTKRERIERLLRQKWSKERIVATVGCAMSYVYIVKREMDDGAKAAALVAKLMKKPAPWETTKKRA
jgi:uncharacterized protein YerC